MSFKGVYNNKPLASKIGGLFLLMFISVIIHTLIAMGLVILFFDNGINLIIYQDLNNQDSIDSLKLMQLFSGAGLFITPMLVYSYLTNFDFKFLSVSRQNIMLVIAIMMLITPFIGLLLEWNMMIPFPEWLIKFDINSEVIITAFLQMDNILDLAYTILVIAIVPAIGEELLFRGYIQQKMEQWLTNPHIPILITSLLFSIIHFQFQGVVPRFVLGALLGYLFYWSKSLWLPILAHFINNAQAVIFSYPSFEIDNAAYSLFSESKTDPILALFSFVATTLLLYMLYQNISIKKGCS